MAVIDNNSQNRGIGKWKIQTYNPSSLLGPIEGVLLVNKDFYTIYKDEKMTICLFNVPSQNVAFAYNEIHVQDFNNMWYRLLNEDNPSYEVKLIAAEADKLIRKMLFLKTNYYPTDKEVDRAISRLFDHLIKKYDSIENVRSHSKGLSLFSLIEKNVEELFGSK